MSNSNASNTNLFVSSAKLPSGVELILTFEDNNPESDKVDLKIELHENGQLMQDSGCNTAVSRSSFEGFRKNLNP